MATDTPNTIPRWYEALLLQIVVALVSATGVVLLKGLELGKFWLIGAAIAAIPHARSLCITQGAISSKQTCAIPYAQRSVGWP